jgi:two-component system, LytTR family, sensor kinase
MESFALRARAHSWTSGLSFWTASIWLGFGLVDAAQTVIVLHEEGRHHPWFQLFIVTVLFWLPWALATVPVIRLGRRFPLVHIKPVFPWIVHLAACLTLDLVFTVWTTWLGSFVGLSRSAPTSAIFSKQLFETFLNRTLSSVVLYAGILAVSYVVDSKARLAEQQTQTARLNEQLSMAQLDALRKQIEPHFLFNTLNAVCGLVRAGRDEDAVTMIAALSDFLRHTLERSSRQQVPLAEELEFTEKYLSIEKVRFADRLQVDLDVPLYLQQAQVPSLILQPIVENAVKHGIAKRAQGGTIRIAAALDHNRVTLMVSNDGPPLFPSEISGLGIGNANVRTRLRSLYGEAFEFTILNGKTGGVEVSVSIPYTLSSPAVPSLVGRAQ